MSPIIFAGADLQVVNCNQRSLRFCRVIKFRFIEFLASLHQRHLKSGLRSTVAPCEKQGSRTQVTAIFMLVGLYVQVMRNRTDIKSRDCHFYRVSKYEGFFAINFTVCQTHQTQNQLAEKDFCTMHDRKLGTYKHDAKGLICLIALMWSRYHTCHRNMQAPLAAEMEQCYI